jgi:cytidyltransferase-like protein
MPTRFICQIVGLRPEHEEWYRVLHRHVFPGVLDRIARSNIRNYSIYLHDNVLLAHLEYVGTDYAADMAAIAADQTTKEWWKLTDPMQVAFDDRAPGEWWTQLSVLHEWQSGRRQTASDGLHRTALVAPLPAALPADPAAALAMTADLGFETLRVLRSRYRLYAYAESTGGSRDGRAATVASLAATLADALALASPPVEIEEVFHTDGDGQQVVDGKPRSALEPAVGRKPAAGRKVFVSGCFDMLHSGHVAFLREAARHGAVHVGIGSDATIHSLKGRYTVNTQDERKYMIEALDCVAECRVNRGSGFLDFEPELRDVRPDLLIVNEDGHSPAKEALCRSLGIEYLVLQRIPHAGLPARATTALRAESRIPFRIDLAGGWLDQPFVSCHFPGPVLTVSIEPTLEFNDRSGMASSTRHKAIELWHAAVPQGDPEQLARVLFSYENPPGTTEVAGSQDALGLVLPGLNRLYYDGSYWPSSIESVHDEEVLSWIESHLHLVTLGPRVSSFRVLDDVRAGVEGARALSIAAEDCWRAMLARDVRAFGDAFRRSFEAQVAMFPLMVDDDIRQVVERYRNEALGWKLSGAGGGGYLILVSEAPVPNTVGVKIRRRGTD